MRTIPSVCTSASRETACTCVYTVAVNREREREKVLERPHSKFSTLPFAHRKGDRKEMCSNKTNLYIAKKNRNAAVQTGEDTGIAFFRVFFLTA